MIDQLGRCLEELRDPSFGWFPEVYSIQNLYLQGKGLSFYSWFVS